MRIGDLIEDVKSIARHMQSVHANTLYFRGHTDNRWNLMPGLGRLSPDIYSGTSDPEKSTYREFVDRGGALLPEHRSTWDELYLMQHHGVPTRLLDWTESLAVALYFATQREYVSSQQPEPTGCVYILNPNALNEKLFGSSSIVSLNHDFPEGFMRHFLAASESEALSFPRVLAVGGMSRSSRIHAQKGVFTIHGNPMEDLESICRDCCPEALGRVDISPEYYHEIQQFLWLMGVNEFSIFENLDALGKYVRSELSA